MTVQGLIHCPSGLLALSDAGLACPKRIVVVPHWALGLIEPIVEPPHSLASLKFGSGSLGLGLEHTHRNEAESLLLRCYNTFLDLVVIL